MVRKVPSKKPPNVRLDAANDVLWIQRKPLRYTTDKHGALLFSLLDLEDVAPLISPDSADEEAIPDTRAPITTLEDFKPTMRWMRSSAMVQALQMIPEADWKSKTETLGALTALLPIMHLNAQHRKNVLDITDRSWEQWKESARDLPRRVMEAHVASTRRIDALYMHFANADLYIV
jgi:hypothetical protein